MPKLLEGGATRIVCGLNEEIKKSLHDLFITAYYHLLFDFTVSLASYDFFFLFTLLLLSSFVRLKELNILGSTQNRLRFYVECITLAKKKSTAHKISKQNFSLSFLICFVHISVYG